jgi:hypothetical protein
MDDQLKQRLKERELNLKNYSGPHCCFDLDSILSPDEVAPYNVKYNSRYREYYLKSLEGPYIRTIDYCPWCGAELLKSLRDVWYDVMDTLNINPNNPTEKKQIPEEFQTDEWWKKRGL